MGIMAVSQGSEANGHKCYLQVVAWDRFQHYKDRNPPWIKFYNSLLEDPGMAGLPDASKAHLYGIWLLASRLGNRIPADSHFIGRRINATAKVDLKSLVLMGFLEPVRECLQHASEMLATCARPLRGAYTETEQSRGERETERESIAPAYVPPDVRGETAIMDEKRKLDRKLMGTVAILAERLNRDTGDVMQEVTAYKKADGSRVGGRVNPADLTHERAQKSLEDAEAWSADLDKADAKKQAAG
jgi:hypothetical protein